MRIIIDQSRPIRTGAVVLINACAAFFAGAFLWLISVFHLDDGVAVHMSSTDWWLSGALRLAIALAVAFVLGLVSYGVSRLVLGASSRVESRQLAIAAAGVALTGGVIGAIQFVVTRPVF